MNIDKMAKQDAFDWARAEMFFGEGAGTKRKLLGAEINHKVASVPGYLDAFNEAYSKQNFAEHAIKAAKLRKKIDRDNVVGKNVRAIIRGDVRNIHPAVYITGAAALWAHKTGYDKVLLEKAKVQSKKAQARVRLFRATHNI